MGFYATLPCRYLRPDRLSDQDVSRLSVFIALG